MYFVGRVGLVLRAVVAALASIAVVVPGVAVALVTLIVVAVLIGLLLTFPVAVVWVALEALLGFVGVALPWDHLVLDVAGRLPLVLPVVVPLLAGYSLVRRGLPAAIRSERRLLVEHTHRPSAYPTSLDAIEDEDLEAVERTTRRLATQADVPVPELRIHRTRTPLAYTTYRPTDPIVRTGRVESPVVVLSQGLVDDLSPDERAAIVAHELAHVANDDLRLLSSLLLPVLFAEYRSERNLPLLPALPLVTIATGCLSAFTRGREVATDRIAVDLLGDPDALASALRSVYGRGTGPTSDLRDHATARNAVDVAPVLGDDTDRRWLFWTHPALETRLAELRATDG